MHLQDDIYSRWLRSKDPRPTAAPGIWHSGALSTAAAKHGPKPGAAKKAGRKKVTAKYSDGTGNVWSGRGPRPIWLREALAAGKALEDFLA